MWVVSKFQNSMWKNGLWALSRFPLLFKLFAFLNSNLHHSKEERRARRAIFWIQHWIISDEFRLSVISQAYIKECIISDMKMCAFQKWWNRIPKAHKVLSPPYSPSNKKGQIIHTKLASFYYRPATNDRKKIGTICYYCTRHAAILQEEALPLVSLNLLVIVILKIYHSSTVLNFNN